MKSGSRIIDTTKLIDEIRAASSDTAFAQILSGASMLLIAWGELLVGGEFGQQGKVERERITIAGSVLRMLPVTVATSMYYAKIFAQLTRDGKRIPTNDIWIAATAMDHGLVLDTTDEHFDRVEGLTLV